MAEGTLTFPTDFLWGAATSSHQVEGNNTSSDWWAWEQEGLQLGDGRVYDNQTSALACNWWEDAESDIARMADMGHNTHRLSIEWSRIEPIPGKWDEDAIDRYRQIVGAMRDVGIEPMVTLHHFTNPQWMAEQGGWAGEESPTKFARYVGKAVDSLSDLVTLWCTINEPAILAEHGYRRGDWPPGVRGVQPYMAVSLNLMRAHAAAYEAIHDVQPEARVGLVKAMTVWEPPARPFIGNRLAARVVDVAMNDLMIRALADGVWGVPGLRQRPVPELQNTLDWWGVNYYHRYRVHISPFKPRQNFVDFRTAAGFETGPDGWGEIYPQGLYRMLTRTRKLGVPVYVTENGRPDEHDRHRPRFIIEHLQQVWRALVVGVPIMGYYHWSLVDNFEWARAYNPRYKFGLIEVDVESQERRIKQSGELYAEICRTGTVSSDMVLRYAPEALATVFPGEAPALE